MFKSPSCLPEDARKRITEALNANLADGLDLQSQIKVAHWNIKGPRFPGLHLLFDTFAAGITVHNDTIAERTVTLGGKAYGTARHVARTSRLTEYPQETARDVEHAQLVAERIESYLQGVQQSRSVAEEHRDADTVDVLTQVIREFEKHAWMLRASLEA
jgi:starvation-inducible DNA-binding protein